MSYFCCFVLDVSVTGHITIYHETDVARGSVVETANVIIAYSQFIYNE